MTKKSTIAAAGGVCLALTLNAAINWNLPGVEKFTATDVVVSSNPGGKGSIIDCNTGTRWQASPAQRVEGQNDWFFIDLGETKTFTDIEIIWEASYPEAYTLYVGDVAPEYTTTDNVNFLTNLEALPKQGEYTADMSDLTQNISGEFSGRYVLVYADSYSTNAKNYGISCFELTVGNIADRTAPSSVEVADVAATRGAEVEIVPVIRNMEGDVIADAEFVLECADPNVTVNGNKISASAYGRYTVTLKCGSLSKTFTFDVSGSRELKIDIAEASTNVLGADPEGKAANAFDGTKNSWVAGRDGYTAPEGESAVLVARLGNAYDISLITLDWEGANADKYLIQGSEDGAEWTTYYTWENRIGNARMDYVEPEDMKNVRWVRLVCETPFNADWGFNLYEMEIFGVESGVVIEKIPTSIGLSVDKSYLFTDETAVVKASVLDQFGDSMSDVDVTLDVENGSVTDGVFTPAGKGKATVTASYEGLESKSATMDVFDRSYRITPKTAVSNVTVYNNDDTLNEERALINNERVIDGNLTTSWQAYRTGDYKFEVTEGENANIVIDLGRKYNLDLVMLYWEGASSKLYTIEGSEDGESYSELYSYSWSGGVVNRTDVLYGNEAEGVRYLRFTNIETTTPAYGLNLYEIEVYGERAEPQVATVVDLYCDGGTAWLKGEKSKVYAKGYDQDGEPMLGQSPVIRIFDLEGFTGFDDEPFAVPDADGYVTFNAEGSYYVAARCGDVVTGKEVHVYNAEKQQSINLFDGKYASATVTVNGAEVEDHGLAEAGAANLILDHISAENTRNEIEIAFSVNENMASVDDFDYIEIKWEAACAADYEIYVRRGGVYDAEPVHVMAGREYVAGLNPVDRIALARPSSEMMRAAGAPVDGLKIVHLKDASDYETKLMGVSLSTSQEALGVSETTVAKTGVVNVIDMQGRVIRRGVAAEKALEGLGSGLYIVGDRKVAVK